MRITKDADDRKNEILDVSGALFSQKGFDATTISDIIEKVGVARGTVYYHFKSKEDIMDALIERYISRLLAAAKKIADDKSIPVFERFFQTLMVLVTDNDGSLEVTADDIHKPQNALMHQKMQKAMMEGIPPILTGIVEDGIKESLFDTPYPYETMEMAIAHTNTVFDNYSDNLTEKELVTKIKAFIFNLERLFGTKAGSFDPVMRLFNIDGNGADESC